MSEVSPSPEPDDPARLVLPAAGGRVTAPRVGHRGNGRLGIWALVCAPVAAILIVVGSRTSRPEANPVPPPEAVRVLVAGRDIPPDTAITADNLDTLFQWAELTPAAVPPGAVGEPTRLIGNETVRALKAGEPVAEGDVRAEFRLPEGCKQVTLRGYEPDGFEYGFTRGTKVDVWLIPRGKERFGPAERVLSGVFVVPCSMIDRLNDGTGEAESHASVSLGVTPDQCEKLAAADVRGTFRIVRAK